jgi:hypothetical protein
MLADGWALEDSSREPRLFGIYATLPVAQSVAACLVSTEMVRPKKNA